MKRRNNLFTRMRYTKNETDVRKYKECKKNLKKAERQSCWTYVNNIIKNGEPNAGTTLT